MTTRLTVGAGIGAVLFVLFFATLASELVYDAPEIEPKTVAANLR